MIYRLPIFVVASSILLLSSSLAGNVTIKNDDTSELEVIVEPGEGSLLSSTPQIKRKVKALKATTIQNISKDDLGDVSTFSVIGKVTLPSIYNRCSGLFFNKNYHVVFTPAKMGGVVCHCTEIVDSDGSSSGDSQRNAEGQSQNPSQESRQEEVQAGSKVPHENK